MITFWLLACAMISVVLFILFRILIVHRSLQISSDDQANIAIYRARDEEIQRDVDSGVLSQEQADAVRHELSRTLLNEVNDKAELIEPTSDAIKPGWWTVGVIIICLPLVAVSIYFTLGEPDLVDPAIHAGSSPLDDAHASMGSIEVMVENLRSRLEQQPEDAEGWSTLFKSYMALGKYNEAVYAIEQLYKLTGDKPAVLLGYADALIMASGGKRSGKAEELINKALEIEPENGTGLWLAGMGAYDQGEFSIAIDYWKRLLPQLKQDSSSFIEINQLISQAEKNLGIIDDDIKPVIAKTEDTTADGKSINVSVVLDPQLIEKTESTDTLFIFARPVKGPPMPIAVLRKQVQDLPLTVTLDDSLAIMPTRKLSDFDQAVVGARISRSGNAIPQQGDLTGEESIVSTMNNEPVEIIINSQIP